MSRPIPVNLQLNENLNEIENVEMDAVARTSQLEERSFRGDYFKIL